MVQVGLEWGGLYLFNSLWFMLLFVPSLFYNPNYRKAVFIVYAITLVLNLLGAIAMEVNWMMLSEDQRREAIDHMTDSADQAGGAADRTRGCPPYCCHGGGSGWKIFKSNIKTGIYTLRRIRV